MGKHIYIEGADGISGDMTVAALLDLGADETVLKKALNSLPLSGYTINISRVKVSGIDAVDFDVLLETDNHDHDDTYLYGAAAKAHDHDHHGENHGHAHHCHHHNSEDLKHPHCHDREQSDHHHDHEHRGLRDIRDIINQGNLTEAVRALALRIFDIIAEAESKAHGVDAEKLHFHEVGAVDSIVDVVAAAVCADNLGIDRVTVTGLTEGTGSVHCAHGIMPVPVPATANIAMAHHLPLRLTDRPAELVTPTGAAIASALMTDSALPEPLIIKAVGIGAGKRKHPRQSTLRIFEIESEDGQDGEVDEIVKIETNIDDATGELLGYVMEKLFDAGARDVYFTPITMKKNRPAVMLSVIADDSSLFDLEEIILRETTTIGLRKTRMGRRVMKRHHDTVMTPWGDARIKICEDNGERKIYPEYESVRKIAQKSGEAFLTVFNTIKELSHEKE